MNRSPTLVGGVRAGHCTNDNGPTGCTVLLFEDGAVGGVWVPGSAPGSRELGALDSTHLAGKLHGICLSGGSAFGLAAADGVMEHLARRKLGFETPHGVVPIVVSAILYDLHTSQLRPTREMGLLAADNASTSPLAEGQVGAAAGAMVGSISGSPVPGGTGCWGVELEIGGRTVRVGVVVALNALGSVFEARSGEWVAGGPPLPTIDNIWRGATTLVAITTDASLERSGATIVAKMASAGLARAIEPVFSPFDGDTVFVASTGNSPALTPSQVMQLGTFAARAVTTAVLRAASSAQRR